MNYIDKYCEVRSELITYQNIFKVLRKKLMVSNVPIEECMRIMTLLNFAEDGTCESESYFLSKEYINQDLKRVLEMI